MTRFGVESGVCVNLFTTIVSERQLLGHLHVLCMQHVFSFLLCVSICALHILKDVFLGF